MAATFNMLRGTDLIWNYVVNNYLLGEDYPAFDLLHWNGDVTNLPAKWHEQYLRDLYRDNRLVEADALQVDDTPVDLGLVETPCYIQASKGRPYRPGRKRGGSPSGFPARSSSCSRDRAILRAWSIRPDRANTVLDQ